MPSDSSEEIKTIDAGGGLGQGTSLEVAEKLTNACGTVEERRFSAA
jgi:hypothetical protein